MSISFKGKKFKVKQEIVNFRFKKIEMKTLNLRKKKIDTISNLIGLEKLTDIEALILDDNRITEIGEFPNLKNLKFLSLKNNNIQNIKIIEGLTNLAQLDLTGNEINNISGLEHLPNLQILHLENNQITEINNLEYLQKLEFLFLDNNQITEIKNLENLKHLTSLSLPNNQITEVKNLNELRVLRSLFLQNNRITRIFPIHLKYLDVFIILGNPFYTYLKSRFANLNPQKIIEYSIDSEGLEKRLGVGKKNIYVPLDYSNLANVLTRIEDVLYSTLCVAIRYVTIPGGVRPRGKTISWKAHILLTESGFCITAPQGEWDFGSQFLEWGQLRKVKGTPDGRVVLFGAPWVNILRPSRAKDFEPEGSFRNRFHSFGKLCLSLWEEYRKQEKITEKKTYYCDSCEAEIISEDLKCNECGTNNKKRIKNLKKLEAQEKKLKLTHERQLKRVKILYYDLNRTIQDIADEIRESMMTVKKYLKEIEKQDIVRVRKHLDEIENQDHSKGG